MWGGEEGVGSRDRSIFFSVLFNHLIALSFCHFVIVSDQMRVQAAVYKVP